ncbi:MAG: hypothetical protein ACI4QC_04735, partial [Thermoguttaceae bacterium]
MDPYENAESVSNDSGYISTPAPRGDAENLKEAQRAAASARMSYLVLTLVILLAIVLTPSIAE